MDTSIYFGYFTLFEAPNFGWHEHQRCIVAKYHDYGQLLYVYIEANYTHIDPWIPVLQQLQP